MRATFFWVTALTALISSTNAACENQGGNWYCDEIEAITYRNFGAPGTYQRVTSMDNGKCSFTPQPFAGGMSPLNGEISWHFRGPMRLKQFAFYTPGTSEKRENTFKRRSKTHNHGHKHIQRDSAERPEISNDDSTQGAAQDSDRDTSTTQLDRESIRQRGEPKKIATFADDQAAPWIAGANNNKDSDRKPAPAATSAVSPAPTNVGADKWGRQAYYNAEQASASGVVFLNNKGGQKSGTWDSTWGNSLSYASADGKSDSATPQILADVLLPDITEFSIFSSRPCSENATSSCGFYRPNSVAYHGFDGPSKLFLLEFSMPLSGVRGHPQADTPAAWILNAEIPRVAQYNACSCWASGCGEFDVYEPLDSGNTKCKSTFHSAQRSGGSSDWFARPTGKPIKVAVWFDGPTSQGVISRLPDDANFVDVVENSKLASWFGQVDAAKRRTFDLPK